MFTFTEEQNLIRESADSFVKQYCSFDAQRQRAQLAEGYDPKLWAIMAELGWFMLPFDEDEGGVGGGVAALIGLYEAFGRGLVLEPYFASVTLGAGCVRYLADAELKAKLIDGIISGELRLAAAFLEPRRRFDLVGCDTSATPTSDGYIINGQKSLVLGAGHADQLIVLARTAGSPGDIEGRTLFLVPSNTKGLTYRTYRLRDSHSASDIVFSDCEVDRSTMIGKLDDAASVLEAVTPVVQLCLAAEALGIMTSVFSETQSYLGTRKQFGRPIGSFQVLSHRLTEMYVHLEETRSLVYAAANAEGTDAWRVLAAEAKLKANVAGLEVTKSAIQMHGGIGVTEEYVIGHYYRRMMTLAMLHGDTLGLQRYLNQIRDNG